MNCPYRPVPSLSLLLVILLLASGPAAADMNPGSHGDGVVDLICDPGVGLTIDTDSVTIDAYSITSMFGIFTGDPADNLGWLTEDNDFRITGAMGFDLTGAHSLGDVIGSEWLGMDLYYDLTMDYTIPFTPGAYSADLIIIPEPASITLLALASLAFFRTRAAP